MPYDPPPPPEVWEEMKLGRKDYSGKDFSQDVAFLCRAFAASWQGHEQTIRDYIQREYPDLSPYAAVYRAHLLALVFGFFVEQCGEMEAEGILGPEASILPTGVIAALYRYLVLMPWPKPAPTPLLVNLLSTIREEMERQ